MITILLVDDQAAARRTLRTLLSLEAGLVVLGDAADGGEALTLAAELTPDVVLMDIEMPGMDGIDATERLQTDTPHSAVVMLSLDDSAATRARAAAAGAAAFVGKHESPEVLVATIRRVADGRRATRA